MCVCAVCVVVVVVVVVVFGLCCESVVSVVFVLVWCAR